MRAVLVAAAILLVAACGEVPAPASSGDYKLYEATSSSTAKSDVLAVIDSRSHTTDRTLPLGTPSPDWHHLYSVSANRLIDTDPISGATLNTLPLPGGYQLPPASISGVPGGLSQNGKWLTLEAWERAADGSPTATHLLLIDTSFREAPARIDLHGFFEFDAVSNDGQRVYLIEYLGGNGYRVRMYNVLARLLDPQVIVDKSDGQDAMAGVRLMGVQSPDGQWQYSVYARQNDGAFIHALNLTGIPIAVCVFLPGAGYAKDPGEFRWSLAMSPDGSTLYAANGATGVVAEVDIAGGGWPTLGHTTRIGQAASTSNPLVENVQAKAFGANTAVVSPDGRTLVAAGGSGVVWLDTANLIERRHALDGSRVSSLGLSPDGRELYVVDDSGTIAQLSVRSGAVEGRFDPGLGAPMALIRVAAPEV